MQKMQAFHQSLSASNTASNPRRAQLASLTRVKRDQITTLTNAVTWYIWEADQQAAPAAL